MIVANRLIEIAASSPLGRPRRCAAGWAALLGLPLSPPSVAISFAPQHRTRAHARGERYDLQAGLAHPKDGRAHRFFSERTSLAGDAAK